VQVVDYNFFAWAAAVFGSTTADFKRSRVAADAELAKQMAS
jgi:hypothetical protein